MQKFISSYSLLLILFLAVATPLFSQDEDSAQYQILDEIIAVVGGEVIIASELKDQKVQYSEQYGIPAKDCVVFEQLLNQKLFLHNAKIDSVEVSGDQVESEMDRRMRYFIQQIGSEKKLEEFYGKSIVQLKKEFRELIREQLLIQSLQQQVSSEFSITPAEVKEFYENIPKDSLPLVNSQIEVAQLVILPEVSNSERRRARKKLEDIRKEIKEGKDFATQAVLYSDDPGSAAKGGDLGMVDKGQFVPEFDAVALSLQDGELSTIFESQFGFHLMQMLERRGEKYRARHILVKPKISSFDRKKAKDLIDSLYNVLQDEPDRFTELVLEYSQDEETKNSGGILLNRNTGTPRLDMGEIDGQLFYVVDNLEKGDISEPSMYTTNQGKEGYRIVKLLERSAPHKANLKDDYQTLQEAASADLRANALEDYIKRKIATTFVRINPEYQNCDFNYNWLKDK